MGSDVVNNDHQVILATASYDHTIKFWQASSGTCKRSIPHGESQINAMEITPDKQLIALASHQHIRMHDLVSGNPNPVVNYEGVTKNVTAVGFQEDGKWMYTGGEDCSAKIWDLRSRNLQCQRIFQVNAPVNTVCLHPNQSELYVGDQCGIIHIWDLKTNRNEQLIPDPDASIQCICINSEGNLMASINNKGICYVWMLNQQNGDEMIRLRPRKKLEAHQRYGIKCKISPDSKLLVTTSADFTAKIWRISDFALLKELKHANQRWVWDVAFSGNSEYVITASSDNNARLWHVESGEVRREYIGHQKAISCMAFRDVAP